MLLILRFERCNCSSSIKYLLFQTMFILLVFSICKGCCNLMQNKIISYLDFIIISTLVKYTIFL